MVDQPKLAEKLEERFPGKYLSLTSYKRDGSGVSTPVWFVIDDRRLLVMTDPQSFKVKRIRRNPKRDDRALHRDRAAAKRPDSGPGRAAPRQRTPAVRATPGTQIEPA
jgi:uncharacterized protein